MKDLDMLNTSGVVIFGPGSEWLWTMLQFVALSVTFYAIYRQLRLQQQEIRDNTKVLRAEAHHNCVLLAQRPWEFLLRDEGLARVVKRAYESPEALSDVEWERASNYMYMQFNAWEYVYYQDKDGSIPRQLMVGTDAYHKSIIASKPGYVRFWREFGHTFDDPFRSYVTAEFARRAAANEARGVTGP
ncbi:MAG TPA: hypothetical protein PL152_04610 [Steroidobacteraceae bacterium]|nr:hypothetical protein [Steroidobacteraceae bacterium]HQR48594.1 hypothetical protein [Steroidobacteraceae bacterium]